MNSLRILVAEDDPIIAMYIEDTLLMMGHEVCAMEFGQAATVRSAARCRPDLLIVDARLDDGSGVAAVQEILKHQDVAHLFISGDTRELRLLETTTVVIAKPFHDTDLARAIEEAMAKPMAPPQVLAFRRGAGS